MRRREFIALMGASVAWPFAAMAQQAGRTYRLGSLLPLTRDAPINAAFLDELRRRGFIEGQNFTVEYRAAPATGDSVLSLDLNRPARVAEVTPHLVAHSSTKFIRQYCQCLAGGSAAAFKRAVIRVE
jgi:hypothetical protein